jgi:hypothetical protein
MQSAAFGLLVGLCFEPLHATTQTRCEVAAGSIVSAEGEISLLGAAGSIQFVAAGAERAFAPGRLSSSARGAEPPFASKIPVR